MVVFLTEKPFENSSRSVSPRLELWVVSTVQRSNGLLQFFKLSIEQPDCFLLWVFFFVH